MSAMIQEQFPGLLPDTTRTYFLSDDGTLTHDYFSLLRNKAFMGREFSRNDKFLAAARSKNHTSSHETLIPNRGHSREGVPLLNVAIAFADRGDRTQKEPAGSLSAPGDGAMPLSVPCQAKRRERKGDRGRKGQKGISCPEHYP